VKRVLLVLLALALTLSLAGVASAAAPKVPKTLLLIESSSNWNLILVTKLTATVKTAAGPVKIYAINGEQFVPNEAGLESLPIVGTGHVNDQGVFHFSVTGSAQNNQFDTDLWTYHVEGKLTLATSTGTYMWQNFSSAGGHNISSGTLTVGNTTDVTIPYLTGGGE
jgi:hypothetical protein